MSFRAAETVSVDSGGRSGFLPRFLAAAMPSLVGSFAGGGEFLCKAFSPFEFTGQADAFPAIDKSSGGACLFSIYAEC